MLDQPPHNAEAERAVIGSALVYGEPAITASDALRADEFFLPHHREAWKAIVKLAAIREATDPITVKVELEAAGTAGRFEPNWSEWAFECAQAAHVPQTVCHYAKMVREKAASRKLIEVCTQAIAMAVSSQPWEEQIRGVREGAAALEMLSRSGGTVHVREAIKTVTDDIERQQEGIKIPRIYSGISTLDRVVDGFEPGDLVVVAARPGVGKSALVGNIAAYNGFKQVPSFFVSVEMMLKKLGRRWLSGDARINSNKLKRGDVTVDEWKKLGLSHKRFDESTLWVNDRVSRLDESIGEIRKWHATNVAPRFARTQNPDDLRSLVVADYAQRFKVGRSKGDTREQEAAQVPISFKSLAKEIGCVFFLVAMLGREVEKRGGDPILSDLRETGSFEQEADIVLFLTHDEVEGDRIIVAKNREGEMGAARCKWEKEITMWSALGEENAAAPDARPNWQDGDDR